MLSDRERKTLHEVERHWMAEDPGFVAAFDVVGPHDSRYSVQWAYDLTRAVYMTAMVVAVGLMVAMLVLSAPGGALLFAALAVVTAVLWCHQDEDRQGS